MDKSSSQWLAYKRSRFSTRLPVNYLYSPSHAWAARQPDGRWRVGLTKFATRMLGDMVDHGFELEPNAEVKLGQILGWVEGFKAISDLYSIVRGEFLGGNPALRNQVTLLGKDPYRAGWMYEVRGETDAQCLEVHDYAALLDTTIDRILQKEGEEGSDQV